MKRRSIDDPSVFQEAEDIRRMVSIVERLVGTRLLKHHENPTASMVTFANLLATDVLGTLVHASDKQVDRFCMNIHRGVEAYRRDRDSYRRDRDS